MQLQCSDQTDKSFWLHICRANSLHNDTGHTQGFPQREKKPSYADRHECSQGHSLLQGKDMGNTQDHRNSIEQWLAVGAWRLDVGG